MAGFASRHHLCAIMQQHNISDTANVLACSYEDWSVQELIVSER